MSKNKRKFENLTPQAQELADMIRQSGSSGITRQELAKRMGKNRLNMWDVSLLELLRARHIITIDARASAKLPHIMEYIYGPGSPDEIGGHPTWTVTLASGQEIQIPLTKEDIFDNEAPLFIREENNSETVLYRSVTLDRITTALNDGRLFYQFHDGPELEVLDICFGSGKSPTL